MYAVSSVILLLLAVKSVRSYPGYWNLNPVHGLYVKPSSDGTKGDLYVAATEDNGVKSQWAVEQPINFLPLAAASQQHPTSLPLPYPGIATPHDDSSNQKRAVIPAPTPSPPIQYAYALPMPSGDNPVISYPYAYPVPSSPPENPTTKCNSSFPTPHYPFQFPLQYFYPQMMSAYSNAMSILKDVGFSEDKANTVMTQHTSPMWPPSSYAYPMYVMVDPNSWIQNQITTTPSTSTSAPSDSEEESTPTSKS